MNLDYELFENYIDCEMKTIKAVRFILLTLGMSFGWDLRNRIDAVENRLNDIFPFFRV